MEQDIDYIENYKSEQIFQILLEYTISEIQEKILKINSNRQMSGSDPQAKRILLQSQKLSNCLLKSNQKQKDDYEKLGSQIQNTLDIMKKKFQQCETNLQEIQMEWDKVKKFATSGPGFFNAKLEEIKSKTKNIESVTTGIKETVSKIKPQKLIELPVEKVKSLSFLFKTIYFILYHKKITQFEWSNFKKLALEFQEGGDFISRLVNVHYKDLKPQQYQALLMLKNDPQFDNIVVNSDYSHDIIDLADWLQYVCVGAKFAQEKKEAQKAYEKIRRDMHRREGTNVDASKKFWKQALQEVDKFQMSLLSYQSEVKAFQIQTEGSLDDLKQRVAERNQMVKSLN